jgi:tight adherence protein B
MPLLPILIALLLLIVTTAGLVTALVHVRRQRRSREARIGLVIPKAPVPARPDTSASDLQIAGGRVQLPQQVRRWFAFGLPHTWGMRAGPVSLCIAGFAGASCAWILLRTGLHFSVPVAGAATLAAFFLTPRTWLRQQQNHANQQFLSLFPETVDMVIRMLQAGLPITAAIRAVATEALPPVKEVFTYIADQMGIGIQFEDALAVASQQIGLPDFRFFAVAISLQRATGGNLATTLGILSDIMRRRRAMRMKARAVTGEVRMSAYVLGAIPFLVIGALLVLSPTYLQPLVSDPRGNVIVAMAVVGLILGFSTIRMMMRSVTRV